jgi:hypothetical protein
MSSPRNASSLLAVAGLMGALGCGNPRTLSDLPQPLVALTQQHQGCADDFAVDGQDRTWVHLGCSGEGDFRQVDTLSASGGDAYRTETASVITATGIGDDDVCFKKKGDFVDRFHRVDHGAETIVDFCDASLPKAVTLVVDGFVMHGD